MKNIPARLSDGSNNPDYQKEYRKNYKKNQDPIKKREKNRRGSQQYREEHPDRWYAYFKPYFAQWYQENKEVQYLRCRTSNIKVGIQKGCKFGYENATILENLYAVGWNENLPDDMCLSHKVSIWWLVKFNKQIPALVVYDVCNIEVVKKKDNNSAKWREVSEDTIQIASKLESKYPKHLKGFTAFLATHKGEIK